MATNSTARPNHCQRCGWYPDYIPQYATTEPLHRCFGCGLWLCIACMWAHDCAGAEGERQKPRDQEQQP